MIHATSSIHFKLNSTSCFDIGVTPFSHLDPIMEGFRQTWLHQEGNLDKFIDQTTDLRAKLGISNHLDIVL